MKAVIIPTNNKSLLSRDNQTKRFAPFSKFRSRVKRQINRLKQAGVDELMLIQGIGHDRLADYLIDADGIDIKIRIIRNPFEFQKADSLVALWMAISEINDDTLIVTLESLLHDDLLELFVKYEGGASCFMVQRETGSQSGSNIFTNQDRDIVEIGDNKHLKRLIFSDSICLCTFRHSGLTLFKESVEEEIRTENSNKKEFASAIYRLIRKENMVCKIKSLDICDIYKIYTDSPRNILKAAANAGSQIDKSGAHTNLRVINTSTE